MIIFTSIPQSHDQVPDENSIYYVNKYSYSTKCLEISIDGALIKYKTKHDEQKLPAFLEFQRDKFLKQWQQIKNVFLKKIVFECIIVLSINLLYYYAISELK